MNELTCYCADASAAAEVVHYHSVTLDNSVHGQVAAVASIGDFAVLENLDGDLNSVNSRTSTSEDGHGSFGGAVVLSGKVYSSIVWTLAYSLQA